MPREAWDALLTWYGPQTMGTKPDLSRHLNSCKIAPGSNPLEDMGRIEDLAAEMCTAGLTLDDHMLYTIFIDALPTKYEVEARNWHLVTVSAAMTSLRLFESGGTTDFLQPGRRGPTLAMLAMLSSPAAAAGVVAAGKAAAAVAAGKMKMAAEGKVENKGSTDEAVESPTRTVVARPWLPAAMAAAPKPPKVVPPR